MHTQVSRRRAALPATAAVRAGTISRGGMAGPMTHDRVSGEAVAPRSLRLLADEAREMVEPAYRQAVDSLPAELRQIAGYHAGWWDAEGHPVPHAGKAVRPLLTLACARAAGRCEEAAARAAAAVELVHDFSLLHDDVMDGDLTRRHRPAAWTVFGMGQAILVGDALLALAVRQLSGIPVAIDVLTRALLDLCRGQSADLAFEQRGDVTLAECVTMAEEKTGALLGAACELGALAGGADPSAAQRYGRFGRQLGVAFQLTDDLLGIWGDPETTGKPAGSDLSSRKKSLPVVAALTAGTPDSRRLAWLYGLDEPWDATAVAHAADLVEGAGGREWAQAEADRRMAVAYAELAGARPDPAAAADLHTLASLVVRRNH
jgi:geranylgeranyl diphosphate synthase type I